MKTFKLDFEEPPKTVRKGRVREEYANTLDEFIKSGKQSAKVVLPEDEKLFNVKTGIKNHIERLDLADKYKIIERKGSLYLITREYSDEQDWQWFIKKRKRTK